jgi:hypothetical protein
MRRRQTAIPIILHWPDEESGVARFSSAGDANPFQATLARMLIAALN